MNNESTILVKEFRQVLDMLTDGVMIVDRKGRYLEVNRVMCERLGYSRDELLTKTIFDIDSPEYSALARERLDQIFEQGHATIELEHVAKNGKVVPVEVHAKVIVYHGEKAVLSFAKDTSERKEMERTLKDNEHKIYEYIGELELKSIETEELYRHLDDEMEKAFQIHGQTILKALPIIEGVTIATHYQPAKKLGGDFYDVLHRDNKVVLYLSDVSGHGLDGAIMSVFVKNTISSYIALTDYMNVTPENILRFLNKQYQEMGYPEDYFIGICLMVLDMETMELRHSSMGFQTSPLVLLGNGETVELANMGLPITTAVPTEMLNFEGDRVLLGLGSTIIISTDGLIEQEVDGTIYDQRLKRVFQNVNCLPPKGIIQMINNDFRDFNNGLSQADDDITLLVFRLDSPEKRSECIVVESHFGELEKIHDWLASTNDDPQSVDAVFNCLQELVGNAIEHGNCFDLNKKITVEVCICESHIFATVEDEGDGFLWQDRCSASLNLAGDQERGRGIAMTKLFSENLFYNDKGNIAYLFMRR